MTKNTEKRERRNFQKKQTGLIKEKIKTTGIRRKGKKKM